MAILGRREGCDPGSLTQNCRRFIEGWLPRCVPASRLRNAQTFLSVAVCRTSETAGDLSKGDESTSSSEAWVTTSNFRHCAYTTARRAIVRATCSRARAREARECERTCVTVVRVAKLQTSSRERNVLQNCLLNFIIVTLSLLSTFSSRFRCF